MVKHQAGRRLGSVRTARWLGRKQTGRWLGSKQAGRWLSRQQEADDRCLGQQRSLNPKMFKVV